MIGHCRKLRIVAVALLGMPTIASAGPGFIESSRVTGDVSAAEVLVRFNCKAEYLRHEPRGGGDRLRIYLEPTGICNGVSPLVAGTRSRLRPFNSDSAHLVDLEYDGGAATGPVITLSFSKRVDFDVDMSNVAFDLRVNVMTSTGVAAQAETEAPSGTSHRMVTLAAEAEPAVAINLASFRRIPTAADAQGLAPASNQHLYYAEVALEGETWYRLHLGDFSSAAEAKPALNEIQKTFPSAWIGDADPNNRVALFAEPADSSVTEATGGNNGDGLKVDLLMEDARRSMAAGDISRAVQIYTKVTQLPQNSRQAEAQEYLAVARERKGQLAHAKAEYERYLSLYPQGEGAARVSQRLAALLATDRRAQAPGLEGPSAGRPRVSRSSDWRIQSYVSQYYRRDANQLNDEDEIVSQSAVYSDVNFDIRRRGERFDFSSRLSAGYRSDLLGGDEGSGDETRVSYAYLDLADAVTGLRGRIGRQSRNTGGVLGRFDGLNIGYEAGELILLNAVVGKPAYSASDGIDDERAFVGASVTFGPVLEDLEVGAYFIQQDIESIDDRQAVGTEFRYFGTNQSLWGLVDYDTQYDELGSAFLQGSWRFDSRLTLHGSIDRRHSPFLSTGNALIGQPVTEFSQLLELLPLEEILQLGIDRSPVSTTYTLGVSQSLTPRLQLNANMNHTSVDDTPESGGVAATPASTYDYYSADIVASSLLREGDVTILGARYTDSDTARVISLTIDSRYPFGRAWRINPRLRIDRRERLNESEYEWLYSPGVRILYRRSQRFRLELEAGRQFSERDMNGTDLDRESYYVNVGYQAFF